MKKISIIAVLAATAFALAACADRTVKYDEPPASSIPAEPTPPDQLPPSSYACAATPAPSYCK